MSSCKHDWLLICEAMHIELHNVSPKFKNEGQYQKSQNEAVIIAFNRSIIPEAKAHGKFQSGVLT